MNDHEKVELELHRENRNLRKEVERLTALVERLSKNQKEKIEQVGYRG